ncbi:UPF0481 protein At3g47200-like [Lycium ferocissimum]|uniref:UPF0481 protein At3g47200-like n=1 Tax=Lycium ferocissimum TaxID=112874 RepID=UPI002815CF4A|nr:UPF0481 protein At3g47200-like [Lycium ferocissimum]
MAHYIEITQMDHQVPLLDQTSVNEATEYEMNEGRKMDHIIEMKETNGQDPSGSQTNKSINQIFDEKFKKLDNSSVKSTTIFKVSVKLRESNPDAYKPKLISIGPYHRHNPDLRSIEKYKLMYLQRFLRRKEGIDVESCIRELEELKDEARKCYDDIEDLDSDSSTGQFLQMLLLDGCFVVEFIRECYGEIPTEEDPIINAACIYYQVRRDLMLLENQLPFFVLTKLHDMTKDVDETEDVDETSFPIMVKRTFLPFLPKFTPTSFLKTECNAENIKHLLQLVHMSCYPSEMKTSIIRNSRMREVERDRAYCRKSLCWNLLPKFRSKETPIDRDHHMPWHDIMPNVTELCEAGVSFTKVGTIYRHLDKDNLEDNTSLFDIKFENGLMKIPCFEVSDDTEATLRNLIAYEQQSSHVSPKYFSDYAIFMDRLVDSERDVSLLRQKGIIRNIIGEDKEVAMLFNKIGKGISISHDFYYKEDCKKIVQHCEKPWNRMKANLRSNYFHSPWAGVSTVAAIILLLLTATQTVLSVLSVIK